MSANEILRQALDTLSQRGKQYDPATSNERSATRAASIFNETFNLSAQPLGTANVWCVLLSVKLARLRTSTETETVTDTIIDIINYFALYGEEITTDPL